MSFPDVWLMDVCVIVEVVQPEGAEIQNRTVMFTSLRAFNARIRDDRSPLNPRTKPKFRCHKTRFLLRIRDAIVMLDDLVIKDCTLKKGPVILVDGQLTLQNSVIEGITGKKGAAILKGRPTSVINVSNVSFRRNNGPIAIRAVNSRGLHITRSRFSKNVVKGQALVVVDSNERFHLEDTYFANNRGGCVRIKDTNASVTNCTFDGNSAVEGTALFIEGSGEKSLVEIVRSGFEGNRASASGGCLRARGQGLNCTIREVRATRNSARDGGFMMASNVSHILINASLISRNIARLHGGAIYATAEGESKGRLIIKSSRITENNASIGGSIALEGRISMEISMQSVVSNNTASRLGGALTILRGPNVLLSKSAVQFNRARLGGSIYCKGDSGLRNRTRISLKDSFLVNNEATEDGGGIFIAAAVLEVSDGSLLQSNRAGKRGGLVHGVQGAQMTFSSCELRLNEAEEGGAVCAMDTRFGTLAILFESNVEILNNTASVSGGGVYAFGREIEIRSGRGVRFERNQADMHGGGVYARDCRRLETQQTTFLHNSAGIGGGAIHASASESPMRLSLNASVFRSNAANLGGAVYLISEANQPVLRCESVSGTLFDANAARQRGGAIHGSGRIEVFVEDTTLRQNIANDKGGAISSLQGLLLVIQRGVLIGNEAVRGGAVSADKNVSLELRSANFTSNSALIGGGLCLSNGIQLTANQTVFARNTATHTKDGGGAIFCEERRSASILSLHDSVFLLNRAGIVPSEGEVRTSGGAVLVLGAVDVLLLNVTFDRNRAAWHGGGITMNAGSRIDASQSTWVGNTAGLNGGALFAHEASHRSKIFRSSFSLNTAVDGGAMYLLNISSAMDLSRLSFVNNSATRSGGGIFSLDAPLEVKGSEFRRNSAGEEVFNRSSCPRKTTPFSTALPTGGAVLVEGIERTDVLARFSSTTFLDNSAGAGGSLALLFVFAVEITECSFLRNSARLGGAVVLDTSFLEELPPSRIIESTFASNSACQGGAMFALHAQRNGRHGNGTVELINLRLSKNFASTAGGFLHRPSLPEMFFLCCDCTEDDIPQPLSVTLLDTLPGECLRRMQSNGVGAHGYGPIFSTDSIGLDVTPLMIENHRSGELMDPVLIRNVDALGQSVPDTDIEISLTADEAVILEGQNRSHLYRGKLVFDGVVLTALPGRYTIHVLQDDRRMEEIAVQVAECLVNERIENLVCVKCEEGSFSQNASGGCRRCPDHAVCANGRVLPEGGYWNAAPESTEILKCVHPDACIQEPETTSVQQRSQQISRRIPVDTCARGYEGPLCGACEEDYGHLAAQECEKCHQERSRTFGSLLVLYLLFVVVLFIKSSWVYDFRVLQSEPPPRDEEAARNSFASEHTSAASVDGVAEMESAPIPEHLEPVPSFGIRSGTLKHLTQLGTGHAETSTPPSEPLTASDPGVAAMMTPRLSPVADVRSESAHSANEITHETPLAKYGIRTPFSIEATDVVDETHVLTKPLMAEALKILITFFQTVGLVLYVQIDWSRPMLFLLRMFNFLGTGSNPYFSLECMFDERSDAPASIQAFVFLLLFPVFVAALLVFLWLLFGLFERCLSILSQRIKSSIVATVYVSFLPISHACFRIMNCKNLAVDPSDEDRYVWLEDTNITCFEGPHRRLLYYLCLPIMAFILLVFPLCFVLFLLGHSNLGKTERLRSWGLLYEAYKYKRRAWELVIFLRKLLLAAVFAFGYHYSILVQTLTAIGITVFSLLAHSITSPYEKSERMLSHMETISLFGSFAAYFGACLIHALDSGKSIISVFLCVVLILMLLRMLSGFMEHLMRTIDWTLGELGKESYYSKPWLVKICMVCRLKCAFFTSRLQKMVKSCAAAF